MRNPPWGNPVLDEVVTAVYDRQSLTEIHVPHSMVFFIRQALFDRTGIEFQLEDIECRLESLGYAVRDIEEGSPFCTKLSDKILLEKVLDILEL